MVLSSRFWATSALLFGAALISHGLETSGPSDDPIATNPPSMPGGNIAVQYVPSASFFADFRPPYPTDTWWQGLTLGGQWDALAGPFPFQSKSENHGFSFGLSPSSQRRFDGTSMHQSKVMEWRAGFVGMVDDIGARKATHWDTQVVCLVYFNGVTLSLMDICLVPGSPYMTFTYSNARPNFTSLGTDEAPSPITSVEWITPGAKVKVTTALAGTYIIYALDGGLTLEQVGDSLVSPTAYSGVVRFAKVVEPTQEAVLDTHVGAVATGLNMEYTVEGDLSTQTWTWVVEKGNPADLLILCYPHHRDVLVAPNYVPIDYMTLKGHMKGVRGSTWVQRHNLPTISWFTARPPQGSCLPELNRTLQLEVDNLDLGIPHNYYFWGGAFAKVAQMATIAEHIGRADLIPRIIQELKVYEHIFDPNHQELLAYDTAWGGIVSMLDVNSQMYNDHHFTYAYSLHGAAVLGKYDPAWLDQHKDFFLQMARSIGNPSPRDPHYAVTRHMDFFVGHSWASGLGNHSPGARAQESSSEAINAYYSLVLFWEALGDRRMVDYSRMLLAIEMAGSMKYWHLYPTVSDEDSPYPEQDFRDLVTVGNLFDDSVGAWLWWGWERTQIAAIQILPLTPIGQVYFDTPWMTEVLDYCLAEIEDASIGDEFKSVIVAAYATVNPQRAYTLSKEIAAWGGGNSWSMSLYFIASQESGSDICPADGMGPDGVFLIQDEQSGQYITLGPEQKLVAAAGVDVMATRFRLSFFPGGGTLQALGTGKYVTADNSGQNVLAATKDSPSGYELFRWYSQSGEQDFQLRALSNKAWVGTADSELVNNGSPSTYRLVPSSDVPPTPLPGQGRLRNAQTNSFVSASPVDQKLLVGSSEGDATIWAFVRIPESSDAVPLYALQNTETGLYVTADPTGTSPLVAGNGSPGAWEHFEFLAYNGGHIFIHTVSGFAVAAQPDATLIDNNLSIDATAQWTIV